MLQRQFGTDKRPRLGLAKKTIEQKHLNWKIASLFRLRSALIGRISKRTKRDWHLILPLLLITFMSSSGCIRNIRLSYPVQTVNGSPQTSLVAGYESIKDNRPLSDIEKDVIYARAVSETVSELVLRDLRMIGMFRKVIPAPFDVSKIDVIVWPEINRMARKVTFEAYTVPAYLLALTGFPGLIYILAGGPVVGAKGEAAITIRVATPNGQELTKIGAEKNLHRASNMYTEQKYQSAGPGGIEAEALGLAAHEAMKQLCVELDRLNREGILPKGKYTTPKAPRGCASDRDCKGDRICENGRCVSPGGQK
ncbi:MAG: hypothetical protein GY849_16875 [Deltaproteobacteria bacterium]|nr:hypothetical protein [Deltaproteobacteria bacterium]